ncbi:hypothetical protein A2154_02850 [Candidatus Gottesmanbacteria bacterium RBG_16_43_7]|uniref:G8 domain-containing protein n=1 Tax=Candidatus Gottesmanbacteria bacterium RBG_16_43_7 TaxID=1798373 RepID=A0A1F5Z8H6_9BACT|nr:MAG: hypothetical protein A2154_02850 [Candidatus Gottesmanbacteria bacterium RBG_16_43_7]
MHKITRTVLALAVLAGSTAPVVMAEDEISGNGAFSVNKISETTITTTAVEQVNAMEVVTAVDAKSATGSNSSVGNMGGNLIDTGDATTVVKTEVTGPSNEVNLPNPCGCPEEEITDSNLISGNGPFSYNKIKSFETDVTAVGQANVLAVGTLVSAKSYTGKNKSWFNMGPTGTLTGNAKTIVKTKVTAPSNTVNP